MNEMLKESFDNFSMHNLFHKIYTNAKTCVLKIYFPENIVKTVYFSEGNIVFASSNAEKDKLVNILLKYKKINNEQLEIVMKQMDKTISLGRNLVNMGFITHKELIWAVKVQIVGIIHSIIIYENGEYSKIDGPLPDGVINLPLNTLKIIFDSLVMFKNREWIVKQINAPDAIYKKTILYEEGKSKLLSNEELQKIADSINGEKSVNEIAGLSNVEDFKTFKLIYALKFLNLIEEKIEDVPITENLFNIEDEPDENIEFAKNFSAKVRDDEPQEEIKEIEDEKDIGDGKGQAEDVFIEFDIEENSSIEISESEEEKHSDQDSDDSDVFEDINDEKDEIKLTEEDLDSVIIDDADKTVLDIKNDKEATQQIENAEEIVSSLSGDFEDDETEFDNDNENDADKTLLTSQIDGLIKEEEGMKENSELEDEIEEDADDLIPKKDKTSHGLLYTLIFILIVVGAGYVYYKFYYSKGIIIPGSSTVNNLKTDDSVTVEKETDITENEVSNLNINETENNDSPIVESKESKEPEEIMEESIDNKQQGSEELIVTPVNDENVENKLSVEQKQGKKPIKADAIKETKPNKVTTNIITKNKVIVPEQKNNRVGRETVTPVEFSIKNMLSKTVEKFNGNKSGYTIRIEIACLEETIQTAFEKAEQKEKLFLVEKRLKRGTCYIVCYGIFDSFNEAASELNRLHSVFFEGGNQPFVSPVKQFKLQR